MVLGDSLADPDYHRWADPADAFTNDLETTLEGAGWDVDVIDLAVSGYRTDQGRALLKDWLADGNPPPDAAILELGTNDAISRYGLDHVSSNLQKILNTFEAYDVEVLLTGTYGDYAFRGGGYDTQDQIDAFEAIFPALADSFEVDLYPYFLDGVWQDKATYTFDQLHPNAEGVDLIVERMLPQIETLLATAGGAEAAPTVTTDPLRIAEGTVSLWLQADDTSGRQGLLSKDASGYGDGGHMGLYLDGSELALRLQTTSETVTLHSGANAVLANEPTHVAFSFDEGGARLYLDDVLVDSASFAFDGGLTANANPLVIGAMNWRSSEGSTDNLDSFFAGKIDEVAVFDQVLPQATIASFHDTGLETLVDPGPAIA